MYLPGAKSVIVVGEVPRICGLPASPPSSAMSMTVAPDGLEPIFIAPIDEFDLLPVLCEGVALLAAFVPSLLEVPTG